MGFIKRTTVDNINNRLSVDLSDDTVIEFEAHYSEYEDCVNLVLRINGQIKRVIRDVFVGASDDEYKFLDTIKEIN
jgi:hypothetical protein